MDKKQQYVIDIIQKLNANKHCTREDIKTAFDYFSELIRNGTLFGSELETRQIGGLLSAALSKVSK